MTHRLLPFLFAALLITPVPGIAAAAQDDAPLLVLADGPWGAEKADTETAKIEGTEWSEGAVVENGLTMEVLYKDPAGAGFRDAAQGAARRARLYDALRHVAETLNADGTVTVMIGLSEADGTGPLAQGGPMFTKADGITNGSVFQRLSTGTIPHPEYAEMALTFDWGYAWHLGTGAPPSALLDLQSVAVHEITHCLGFISLMSADGSSRFSGIGLNTYTEFDRLLARETPFKRLLGGTASAPVFAGSTADLTGGAVVFSGAAALAALGVYPHIHASAPFSLGTSLQHWEQGSDAGDNAVMQPSYLYGTARREYTDADLAVLRDIGWTGVELPDHEPCPVGSVTILQPSAGSIAANASNQAVVACRADVNLDLSDPLCTPAEGMLRVEYLVDGVSRGVSADEAGHFPLDLTLNTGAHTLRARAWRTDSAEDPVEAERSFTITTVVQPPSPKLAVAPAAPDKDFGEVTTGTSAQAVYTVENAGGGTLTGTASLSGDEAFQFAGASTYSLAAGAETTVTVRFAPDKKGSFAGTLYFSGNGGTAQVALSGAGVKNGGLFNCAGGTRASDTGTADLLVALLAATALAAGGRLGRGSTGRDWKRGLLPLEKVERRRK